MSTSVTESDPSLDSNTPQRPLSDHVRWMTRAWTPYRLLLPLLIVLGIVNAAVAVLYPILLKGVIESIEQELSLSHLLTQIGFIMLYGAAHFGIYFCMQYVRARQNIRFEFTARQWGFEHLVGWGRSNRQRFRTGDLITRLTDDVTEKLSWYLCSGIGRVFEAGLIIIFGVGMMLWLNPELTLYTAGPLPILVALFILTASALHKRYEAVQKSISVLNGNLESCFSGIRVIKAFGAEEMQKELLTTTIHKQREAEIRAVRWQTVIDSLYGNIWQLGIVGVLLAGGAMVIRDEITLGELVAFDSYVLLLVWPMFDIGQFFVRGRLSRVTLDRLIELEATPPEIDDRNGKAIPFRTPDDTPVTQETAPPSTSDSLAVMFRDVSYAYPHSDRAALSGINFCAEPGKITAIAGEIGSGKSTLLSLVPRLSDPQAGEITIGAARLIAADLTSLRSQMGYVPQESELLAGTLRENIRFGRDWITESDLDWATELSQLSADLDDFESGLETVIGARGVRLSGGQKQRVSLARALAGRPRILLLDDCTASLDAQTEQRVWDRLLTDLPDCTVLVSTHRSATLERADHVVVLKAGTIVDQGEFAKMFRHGSEIERLYRRWSLEESVE